MPFFSEFKYNKCVFQVTFYPEGTIKVIQQNDKFIPIITLTKDSNNEIKLGEIIKSGHQYAFYPGEEDDFLSMNFDCNRGINWIQRYENVEI